MDKRRKAGIVLQHERRIDVAEEKTYEFLQHNPTPENDGWVRIDVLEKFLGKHFNEEALDRMVQTGELEERRNPSRWVFYRLNQ